MIRSIGIAERKISIKEKPKRLALSVGEQVIEP